MSCLDRDSALEKAGGGPAAQARHTCSDFLDSAESVGARSCSRSISAWTISSSPWFVSCERARAGGPLVSAGLWTQRFSFDARDAHATRQNVRDPATAFSAYARGRGVAGPCARRPVRPLQLGPLSVQGPAQAEMDLREARTSLRWRPTEPVQCFPSLHSLFLTVLLSSTASHSRVPHAQTSSRSPATGLPAARRVRSEPPPRAAPPR